MRCCLKCSLFVHCASVIYLCIFFDHSASYFLRLPSIQVENTTRSKSNMDTVYRMLAELRRWKKAKTAAALPYSLPPPKFKLFDSLAAEVRLMVYRYLFTDLLTPEDRQMESRYDNDKSSIPLVMLIKRYTLYKRFWSSGNWMYADENFQLQFETARAMLHLNKQTRNEVATCLFECVTFYTQTYGVVRRFEKLLTPTAKSLIRHVKI